MKKNLFLQCKKRNNWVQWCEKKKEKLLAETIVSFSLTKKSLFIASIERRDSPGKARRDTCKASQCKGKASPACVMRRLARGVSPLLETIKRLFLCREKETTVSASNVSFFSYFFASLNLIIPFFHCKNKVFILFSFFSSSLGHHPPPHPPPTAGGRLPKNRKKWKNEKTLFLQWTKRKNGV